MIGTLLNTATVIGGTLIGRAFGARFPANIRETAMTSVGLMTVFFGLSNALGTHSDPLIMLFSVLIGGILGELLGIHKGIERLGERLEARFENSQSGRTFGKAFVTTSILFCVGPMTILGCFQDGLGRGYATLAFKSLLDGVSSIAFAATLGWGVLCSAVTVFVVQGLLTLAAGTLAAHLSRPMIDEMTATGGILLFALGLDLLGLKQIRVANFLPALLLAPLFTLLFKS